MTFLSPAHSLCVMGQMENDATAVVIPTSMIAGMPLSATASPTSAAGATVDLSTIVMTSAAAAGVTSETVQPVIAISNASATSTAWQISEAARTVSPASESAPPTGQ